MRGQVWSGTSLGLSNYILVDKTSLAYGFLRGDLVYLSTPPQLGGTLGEESYYLVCFAFASAYSASSPFQVSGFAFDDG